MTIHVTQAPSISGASKAYHPSLTDLVLLAVGFLVMYLPTYITLNNSIWNIVGQGHGPVMLALTLWLTYQRWEGLNALPQQTSLLAGGLALALGLLFYIFGHSQDILLFDVGSQIPLFAGILLLYKGWAGLKKMWFPLFFLIFLVPLPSPVVDALTGPLKAGVSYVAEWLMYEAGYPIGRAGVMLTIGPYQLLVADACAGLNSIFALEAIGVFYMSVAQHTSKARNIALAIAILPISFVSNVIRVISLVLVTYYFGDAVGQGFVHDFAGIVLFMVATALTIFVDLLLGLFFKSPSQAANNPKQTV
jgi:exosortase B